MNIEKIGHGTSPDEIKVVIEVPLNSNIKYEIDKDSGAVEVDRVLYSAMHYPANYGFIPNTLSDDGDPADVLVLIIHFKQARLSNVDLSVYYSRKMRVVAMRNYLQSLQIRSTQAMQISTI